MTQLKNRDVFLKDPRENRLVNQGVAEVAEPGSEQELRTLYHELSTFVCEGQYARGLGLILSTYLKSLEREEQPAVWVSGFYGSGKSHLVKMLRFLWTDYRFPDGVTARGLADLPEEIQADLKELSTQGKRLGGLHAAGGKLGAGAGASVRLALLGIIFRSVGLPEDYAAARFILFLKKNGFLAPMRQTLEAEGRLLEREVLELYASPVLARALLAANPNFAPSEKEVLGLLKAQFPRMTDISDTDMTFVIEEALGSGGTIPATLIVLDEVQQYIGDSSDRAYLVQNVAEACSKHFGARILFVGTGQTAIMGTPQLQKIQARFKLAIELSDADVDTVVRKIVLAKKPDKEALLRKGLVDCSGEISRHLPGTRLAPRPEDDEVLVADYPLLPTRRRFWELALRAIDPTGTRAELRNQLTNVFEAVGATADKNLLTVVPADFLYHQNKTQMVQSGALLREIQEVIERLDDGSASGRLKSRLCALCFLIGRLPREAGADSGLRATPDMLADLLVEDLAEGSLDLRRLHIPPLLAELAEAGTLLQVGTEYRLQTRESAAWENEYRTRLLRIQNDNSGLAIGRADLLRARVGTELKGLKIPQGQSKVQRKVQPHFGQDRPSVDGPDVPVWVRDGWNDDERSVLADARAAGPESPLVTLYLPEHATGELKKHLASAKAASETLAAKGQPSTNEGIEARTGMETRLHVAEQQREALLGEVLVGARVILSGGGERPGSSLVDRVREAAEDALQRLYPRFADADNARWGKVVERARNGAADALAAVGYTGDPEKHRVSQALLGFLAGGKKGREIRKHFEAPPFGWSQDAIDGTLIVLVGTGHLRAAQDGRILGTKLLDQKNLGVADFRIESATVTVQQRLALRRLFQEAAVPVVPNEEASAARDYLQALKALATTAGGDAPLPSQPSAPLLSELSGLTGNEQLVAVYEARDRLSAWREDWNKKADLLAKRNPRWQALERLAAQARSLPVTTEVTPQMEAIRTHRALLSSPDPAMPLIGKLVQALREALQRAREDYVALYHQDREHLTGTETWQRLDPEQQAGILNRHGIAGVPEIQIGTEQDLLESLSEISLDSWATRRDALPQRFAKALEEAAQLLEPKAVRVTLPSATIHDGEELDNWLKKVEATLREKLDKGPVIV
jgi:hypothetical protein